jgi:hypothetical protein
MMIEERRKRVRVREREEKKGKNGGWPDSAQPSGALVRVEI